jgi:hypothetical protein
MVSLAAAQAAMRLDPTLVPPDGSVCKCHRSWRHFPPPVYRLYFCWGDYLASNRKTILCGIDSLDGESGYIMVSPGELSLISLPPGALPITEWRRLKP